MTKSLVKVASGLSFLTLVAGTSYVVLGIWELLRPRFDNSEIVAAVVFFPLTLIAAPVYAIIELNDWRLLSVLVATVVLTMLLRVAKRNFERAV